MRFLKSKPLNISILTSETNFVTLQLIVKSYGNNQIVKNIILIQNIKTFLTFAQQ
jgi:hypothetical protein